MQFDADIRGFCELPKLHHLVPSSSQKFTSTSILVFISDLRRPQRTASAAVDSKKIQSIVTLAFESTQGSKKLVFIYKMIEKQMLFWQTPQPLESMLRVTDWFLSLSGIRPLQRRETVPKE